LLAALVAGASLADDAKKATNKPDAKTDTIAASDIEAPPPEYNMVVLQGLNKVTGHISKLDGPTGTVMRFGTLEIVAHRCWKSNPEDSPENAALLEISETKPGEPPARIFLGWMFSSSPGLSGLEHPVYDINVLTCEMRKDPEKIEKTDKIDGDKTTKPAMPAKPAKKK
jgi:hypothetical protein